ncbi:MAG TPA: ABC transporter substrate-binding protein [Stellaceae bacterium]|nr:ABC transporter substrate-binding protein [Stellaceae bacterium]
MSRSILRGAMCAAIAMAIGSATAARPATADTRLIVGKANAGADSIITVNVGDDAGIFKKHGLDLQIENFQGGSRIVQALIANSIDIAIGAGTQMAFAAKGAPMIAVCESTTTLPYFSIGVPWDSPVHALADLKGKRIGVSNPGSLTDWVAQELDRKMGWGPDGVLRVTVGGGMAASSAAFRAHEIDAYVGGTASFLVEAQKHIGRVLTPVSDFVGNMASGTLFASTHLVKTNPDALRAFLAAWIDTTDFILAHKAETVTSWSKVTGFPETVMSQEYDIVKGMYNPSCRFDPQSLATLRRSFVQLKLLETEPDMSKLYTEAYLPKGPAPGAGH